MLGGQVALVPGATRGIGQQIACDLARAGAMVMLSARRTEDLDETRHRIDALGGRHDRVTLDVTVPETVAAAMETLIARHQRIDLLVNNAGIGAGSEHPWDLPVDEWWAVQEVNLKGVYTCTQADALSGRFIHATDDLDALIAQADHIVEHNLQTLSMMTLEE